MQISNILNFDFSDLILLLTPIERWQAARRLDTNFIAVRWFTLILLAALMSLIALFLWISCKRMVEERKITEKFFIDYAEKRGLSQRERQILLEVVRASGLKRPDAIFTLKDAFDRGATRLIEQSLARNLPAEENESLRTELSFLREKLGFLPPSLNGLPVKPKRLSSRHIPVGRELYITPCGTRRSTSIESTVIKNNDMELTLKLTIPIEVEPGEYWRARFYLSASFWEFDSSVVRCEGDILVLNHSDDVRFINLRRFLRVPVNSPAFVARFPFTLPSAGRGWGPPEFVPAVVTELAGLSLRLDLPLEVKAGERMLVIFKSGSKIMEDIAEVRHTQAIKNGFSIAAELIGLNDSDINELVCATNAAKRRADAERRETTDEGRGTKAAEPTAAQGA